MAKSNLIRVRDNNGNEFEVHPDWLSRWPDDELTLVDEQPPVNEEQPPIDEEQPPVEDETAQAPAPAVPTPKAPRGAKQKENTDVA